MAKGTRRGRCRARAGRPGASRAYPAAPFRAEDTSPRSIASNFYAVILWIIYQKIKGSMHGDLTPSPHPFRPPAVHGIPSTAQPPTSNTDALRPTTRQVERYGGESVNVPEKNMKYRTCRGFSILRAGRVCAVCWCGTVGFLLPAACCPAADSLRMGIRFWGEEPGFTFPALDPCPAPSF